jgi:DNA integrity scanning protein DisA with diadenylate cyclase activity
MRFKFNLKSFCLFLLLLAIEIFIAKFIQDRFIRPFVGDVLVVVLIYFFLKTFIQTNNRFLLLGVWVFACVVELLQWFHLVNLLGLQNNKLMVIILGATFDWYDLLAYSIGIVLLQMYESKSEMRKSTINS